MIFESIFIPTLGEAGHLWMTSRMPRLATNYSLFNVIFTDDNLPRYVIVLNGKEAIQEALVKQSSIFADRPQLYLTVLLENYKGG